MMGSRNMMIEGERRRRGKFEKDPMVSEKRIGL